MLDPHLRETGITRPSGKTVSTLLFFVVVVFVVAFLAGYLPMQRRDAALRAEADAQHQQVPRVEVIHVARGTGQATLTLPGTMQAVTEAAILARADGYLKRRLVDLGDRVKAGQVLAEIDAPELDQQLHQAEAAIDQAQAAVEQAQAALAQDKANRDLAKITAERMKTLSDKGIATQQDRDQSQAQLAAQDANVQAAEKQIVAQRSNLAAARANLNRLQTVDAYRSVKAPFDGVVTQRNVDIGALVSTGNTLLFRIAQTQTLRTFINVPQASVASVHAGQAATLTLADFPGRTFSGKVVRMAHALDPASRTMLVEVDVPNESGALFPGSFADVELSGARANPPIVVPASALVFRADGAQLAVVRPDHTVHLQKIAVGRDYGDRLEVLNGVDEGTTVIAVVGDSAREGAKVTPYDRESQP
ncbi:MAG TPA: efflux RND transporter periplasmic adaptor subunit [Vicinamibacterales bacterium]|nr:efflux RND transporter periplasmic adaptor subunit [Vicinamibacterales bacterium]